ncbi:MAG: hypothetical protein PHS40_09800 [Mariniphaga sp.]|nr:hypothetical protein [Mariniphaga sp.]
MKVIKLLCVFVICLLFVGFRAGASWLRSGFNHYKIEEIEKLNQPENVEKMWKLTYNDSKKPVTVTKRTNSNCIFYVISTDFFEVCYACTAKGFGIGTVKKAWSCVPVEINQAVLNAEELKRQKVIVPEEIDEEKALELIANYLPELLREEYTHLLI